MRYFDSTKTNNIMKTSHRTMHQNINSKMSDIKLFGYVTVQKLRINAIKFKSEKNKGL